MKEIKLQGGFISYASLATALLQVVWPKSDTVPLS